MPWIARQSQQQRSRLGTTGRHDSLPRRGSLAVGVCTHLTLHVASFPPPLPPCPRSSQLLSFLPILLLLCNFSCRFAVDNPHDAVIM